MLKKTFVYLIKLENSELYKIGYSNNPLQRLKSLQTANGERLELIKTFKTNFGLKLEKALHLNFNKYKTLGEWFALPYEEIKKFNLLCETWENDFQYLIKNNTFIQDECLKK
jgi:hypothetical protein